jgi:very-short-patch-repair endonuclease
MANVMDARQREMSKKIVKPLHEFRKQMKRNPTPSEQKFYEILRGVYPGSESGSQAIFGWYILDFVVYRKGVAIELDGSSHRGRTEYDQRRDAWIESCGLKVLRFPNSAADNGAKQILVAIRQFRDAPEVFQEAKMVATRRKRVERRRRLAREGLFFDKTGVLTAIPDNSLMTFTVSPGRVKANGRNTRPRCPGCGRGLSGKWSSCKKCGASIVFSDSHGARR